MANEIHILSWFNESMVWNEHFLWFNMIMVNKWILHWLYFEYGNEMDILVIITLNNEEINNVIVIIAE